jgi:lipoprotein-anchoring transpeptidase ErfK/SrfK
VEGGALAFPGGTARRLARFGRGHKILMGVGLGLVLLFAGASVWAVRYDHRNASILPADTVIGGVPVGGLRYQPAVARLREALEAPLHRNVHVSAPGFELDTTAWDLGLRIDVGTAVHKAFDQNHQGNLVARVWVRLRGSEHRTLSLRPAWTSDGSAPLLEQAKKAVAVSPKNARIDTSTGWVKIIPDSPGRSLALDEAKKSLTQGIQRGESRITLPVTPTPASVKESAFSNVILVRTGENKLYLYQDGQIARSYGVATGRPEFPTPTGIFRVVSKIVNPVWHNPHSSWSASMPEEIPAGPTNPLGTHALALSASGILIHETPDVGSIGSSASHGCIRMRGGDEIDLFSRVSSGTLVAIVSAGAPKPRAPAPTPQSAAQNAAVQY